jgi:tRNA pseudouridine38-40 synthase
MTDGSEPPVSGGSSAFGPVATERLRLDLSYDGTGFHGFAPNQGVTTVGGELAAALERVLGEPVRLTCAGRTDAGVHARSQVVTLDVPTGRVDEARLRRSLNSMLGPRVSVTGISTVPGDFDARFSARWRSYRYRVLTREVPDPFLASTAWWVPETLDVAAMQHAAQHLVGEHDFSSFCRRPAGPPGACLVRRVLRAAWMVEDEPDLLRFEIAATAFCHQMVRSIVGTLVEIGRGRSRVADLGAVLAARDRSAAGNIAPPHGLVLWAVGYPGDPEP